VSVAVDRDSLPADGLSAATVTATITYSDDSSVEGLEVKFYTTLGTITARDTTDSGGTVTAALISGTTAGTAEIAACCLKKTNSVHVAMFTVQDNGVYVSSLTAIPDSIPADGLSESIISAFFKNDADQPAESLIVNFGATLGTITAIDTTDSTGMVTGTLTSSTLSGVSNVRVWYGQARDSIDVTFIAGATGDTIPASVVLYQVYPKSIAVQGSGGNETSTLTFEVRDATGRPVSGTSIVDFVIDGGPSGGEYLHPTSAPTEAAALATTHLNSGTASGPARVVAQVQGTTISSGPVEVTIVGGPPEQAHFCIVTEKLNLHAFGIAGVNNMITAYVGDRYGNPVQNGTAVWFSTECGIIQSGAGNTESGITANTLVSCAPWPTMTQGLFYTHAWTIDGVGGVIKDSVRVLWSGSTVLDLTPASFNIPEGGSESFTLTVCDLHNRPLTGGTTISIVADAGKLQGPSSINIPDTQDSSWTHFDFLLCDNPDDTVATSCEIAVDVTSDNGDGSVHAYGIVH
jgi:adhesin/invasin